MKKKNKWKVEASWGFYGGNKLLLRDRSSGWRLIVPPSNLKDGAESLEEMIRTWHSRHSMKLWLTRKEQIETGEYFQSMTSSSVGHSALKFRRVKEESPMPLPSLPSHVSLLYTGAPITDSQPVFFSPSV
ncbi:hypothetical protein H6P81_000990 [Aristolochia fimbriata]|uniref:Uncharacterized protein n=1 Tax=Aristolochia fimbriata TaxID=158543 RepID=A0AAV7F9M2_ARIFI|nr:hypothetical protein H6P81_000990 [Aristolochia fimbriata]